MGLLPVDTVFYGEKVQRQTKGIFENIGGALSPLNGIAYDGYEIHMGQSAQKLPAVMGSGNVYGSYIHGLFDAPDVADTILKALCDQKGSPFEALGTFDRKAYKEQQYDILADALREHLDIKRIYEIMEEGI